MGPKFGGVSVSQSHDPFNPSSKSRERDWKVRSHKGDQELWPVRISQEAVAFSEVLRQFTTHSLGSCIHGGYNIKEDEVFVHLET